MTYLATILEAEKKAKEILETAELESGKAIADARVDIESDREKMRLSLVSERASMLATVENDAKKTHELLVQRAKKEVEEVRTRVLPKQAQAIATIKNLLVD
jgi:vacuolar-type H+-ATPase subunit H